MKRVAEGIGSVSRAAHCRPLWREVSTHGVFEHGHQFRVHVAEIIWYFQAVNRRVFKQTVVVCLQTLQVFTLHDEDDIGPANILWADGLARIRAGACRANIEARSAAPHGFGSRAAPLVTTADEQQIGQVSLAAVESEEGVSSFYRQERIAHRNLHLGILIHIVDTLPVGVRVLGKFSKL